MGKDESDSDTEFGNRDITWNVHLERIISEEGERAECFSWLHTQAEKKFNRLNTSITLPVIVLSTIAGTASIGAQGLESGDAMGKFINMAFGGLSLVVGVLNTVSSYFSWAKRAEAHRISAITYNKIYRFIVVELALPRNERMLAKDFLKTIREDLDRLNETSPAVPDNIIQIFKDKFEKSTPEVKKPEITNGLDPILAYPPPPDENIEPPKSVKLIASPRSPIASSILSNSSSSSLEESPGATSFTLPTLTIDPEKGKVVKDPIKMVKKLRPTPSPSLQKIIRSSVINRYKPADISIPESDNV
jgi:hypothetical protein